VQPVYGVDRHGAAIEHSGCRAIPIGGSVLVASADANATRFDPLRDAFAHASSDRDSNGDADAGRNQRSRCDRFTQARRGADGTARCPAKNSCGFD
jgi:hypothetical protein